ncbi:unnamed protein product [Candidula unifasciata]|uniref:Target of Nesh-SH3/FNDC1 C-terminal domain-containing protein n=1 Tax=Candidula unifasciata TaxID=100452 RepID=A0A8S4A4V9_9EUPU|nr:unnamed protein product [Candidula unifasciata]
MSGQWLLWIYCVIYVSTHRCLLAASINVQSIEDNCVLSFIIPRDKIKSSCDHNDQVRRHINVMEMKVNLYKQQVTELQIQLDKMRQINNERYQLLERQVTAISANMDMNFLLEHKVNRLETEVQQLNIDVTTAKMKKPAIKQASQQDDQTAPPDSNLPDLSHSIQSMIQNEVKLFADDLTNKFQTYILEQIMLYNKVFSSDLKENGLSRVHENFTQLASKLSLDKDVSEPMEGIRRLIHRDRMLGEEFKNLKVTNAGYQNEKHISSVKSIANDKSRNATGNAGAVRSTIPRYKRHHVITDPQSEDTDDAIDNNESFSGENPDLNDTSPNDPFSQADHDTSSSTSSRISQTTEADANSTGSECGNRDTGRASATNLHLDQCNNRINEMERKLRKEFSDIIYSPLAEVVRLIEKLKDDFEKQILNQEKVSQQANKQLTAHITELQNNVQATQLDLRGMSQDMQESRAKLDKVKVLEELVGDIIRNISTNARSESDLENEEQGKRIKKLERLMGVYQQSLQHYRNETKYEYREMRMSLEKESDTLKLYTKALQDNLNETVTYEMIILNNSYNKKLQEINEQIRAHEEALLLVQTDIQNAEKRLESKPKRSDRDFDEMQETINQLNLKQKNLTKRLENLEQTQGNMNEKISVYAKDIVSLQTESKLNTDEWLPLTFHFDSSRTDCFGDQYVKRTGYTKAKYVGVVLCSETRYKIFLSSSLNGTFMNVGDANGMGEDHCEFVGANRDAPVQLSAFRLTFGSVQGFVRNHWGQDAVATYLNAIKPSPHWYECGVKIP